MIERNIRAKDDRSRLIERGKRIRQNERQSLKVRTDVKGLKDDLKD